MKRKLPDALDKRKKKPKQNFWDIPEIWKGETVFVIGGGPSLIDFDFSRLKGQRIVGINLAYLKMPFMQFCFFADNRFWGWHEATLSKYQHHLISTALNINVTHPHFHMIKRNHDHTKWFSLEPHEVVGKDSGVQAINFAYHLGAQRIILLGFDMGFKMLNTEERADKNIKRLQVPHMPRDAKRRPSPSDAGHLAHWYQEHPIPSREQNYKTRFLPQYSQVHKIIVEQGREIYLATPSAIDCIPQIDLTEVLGELPNGKSSVGSNPRQTPLPEREFYYGVAARWLRSNPSEQSGGETN